MSPISRPVKSKLTLHSSHYEEIRVAQFSALCSVGPLMAANVVDVNLRNKYTARHTSIFAQMFSQTTHGAYECVRAYRLCIRLVAVVAAATAVPH